MSLKYEEITKDIGVGWVKRSAPIKKMENGNDARIVRWQTYNETGFVETNLMGLLCVTHPTGEKNLTLYVKRVNLRQF